MVKKLYPKDETLINEAIATAAKRTSAKISVIVLPASDHYRDLVLLYGFILGAISSLGVWLFTSFLSFPGLLALVFGVATLVEILAPLRRLCIRLTPRRVRHHRAAEIAHREYLALHSAIPKDKPFVLLFISLAERYVHVLTNPVVHAQLPDNWHAITGRFIGSIRKFGLGHTCTEAVEHIAEILEPHFPKRKLK